MKVLHNLLLASDPEKSYQVGWELGLPHILFDLVHDIVKNSDFIKVTIGNESTSNSASIPAKVLTDFSVLFVIMSCSATVECANTWRNHNCARDLLGDALGLAARRAEV